MPGCITFRDAPLEHEEEMRIIFESISCTNETSFVPRANVDNGSGNDVVDGAEKEGEDGAGSGTPSPAAGKQYKEKRPAAQGGSGPSPKGKKLKKTYRDGLMKRLVDAYEKKSESSKNSATSTVVDHVREEIAQMLDLVIQSGAEEGSDEHCYATQLLIKKEYRDVFITLKTPNGRLAWLRRTWEDRKNH